MIDEDCPERGDSEGWVELESEESRCILGLKSYYVTFLDKTEEVAMTLAWADLKREFPRLEAFSWFKG